MQRARKLRRGSSILISSASLLTALLGGLQHRGCRQKGSECHGLGGNVWRAAKVRRVPPAPSGGLLLAGVHQNSCSEVHHAACPGPKQRGSRPLEVGVPRARRSRSFRMSRFGSPVCARTEAAAKADRSSISGSRAMSLGSQAARGVRAVCTR